MRQGAFITIGLRNGSVPILCIARIIADLLPMLQRCLGIYFIEITCCKKLSGFFH